MVTKLVNVRFPEQLYEEGKEIVEEAGYANFQELVKDALRHTIIGIKKDKALIALQQTFGSTKNKTKEPLTSAVKNKIAEELVQNLSRQNDIFRKVGL